METIQIILISLIVLLIINLILSSVIFSKLNNQKQGYMKEDEDVSHLRDIYPYDYPYDYFF